MVEILLNCPQVDLTVGKKYHMFSSSNEDEAADPDLPRWMRWIRFMAWEEKRRSEITKDAVYLGF